MLERNVIGDEPLRAERDERSDRVVAYDLPKNLGASLLKMRRYIHGKR
jgi:hypothetical protein